MADYASYIRDRRRQRMLANNVSGGRDHKPSLLRCGHYSDSPPAVTGKAVYFVCPECGRLEKPASR